MKTYNQHPTFIPKYKVGDKIRISRTGQETIIISMLPDAGGVYYILDNSKGAYHESEIERVDQ
jgi:hypothetical protein